MREDCLFCKIVAGKIKVEVLYEDQDILAFRDINPVAPIHLLIIPKEHLATLNDLKPEHAALAGKLLLTASALAEREGIAATGYRTVVNCNADGGQAVYHIHLHLLGGRPMSWPPG